MIFFYKSFVFFSFPLLVAPFWSHTMVKPRCETSYRFDEGRGRPAGILSGYIDAVALLADAAGRLGDTFEDNDPRLDARTPGDVVRNLPGTYRRAVLALNDGLIDALDLRNYPACSRHAADPGDIEVVPTAARSTPVREPSRGMVEAQLVASARKFMLRLSQGGATLDDLVHHLRPLTELSDPAISELITRHFLVDGDLVLLCRADTQRTDDGVPDLLRDYLKALGYDDCRRDVELERIADKSLKAYLVAYKDGVPMVLVYRTPAGQVAVPEMLERARFQARALTRDKGPRYLYLTDGRFNKYFDDRSGQVVAELQRAEVIQPKK
jgi:hypothetical protein